MTTEQARYDLETLPQRQKMLEAMFRSPVLSYDGFKAIDAEHRRNHQRIMAARAILSTTNEE